jgi:hypothetical protein
VAPTDTVIAGNVFSDLGVYVKQAGAVYSALTSRTTIAGNVAYNLPRAAVNINDGAWGGHEITGNLFFNAVRETQDHGAINTWDREPYLQSAGGSVVGAPTRCTRNLLLNSYYGIHSLDHDDGSRGTIDTGNVVVFAGVKNYEGCNKTSRGNLIVRPDYQVATAWGGGVRPGATADAPADVAPVPLPRPFYFPVCARSVGQWTWGPALADVYANNTCILAGPALYAFGQCDARAPASDGQVFLTSGNTFLTPNGTVAIGCGGATLTLSQAQAVGYEVGSVASDSNALTPAAVAAMIAAWLA